MTIGVTSEIVQPAFCNLNSLLWAGLTQVQLRYLFYSVITVHLFTVTIYTHQLDATLFKKLYSFLKHI
jgi:hypothetical protein